MKFEEIEIGNRYTESGLKTVYMVLSKDEKRESIDVIRLSDYSTFSFETLWMKFEEYDEDFHKPFEQEVQVILYKGGEFIIDVGYDISKLDKNEARVFKAILKEIT